MSSTEEFPQTCTWGELRCGRVGSDFKGAQSRALGNHGVGCSEMPQVPSDFHSRSGTPRARRGSDSAAFKTQSLPGLALGSTGPSSSRAQGHHGRGNVRPAMCQPPSLPQPPHYPHLTCGCANVEAGPGRTPAVTASICRGGGVVQGLMSKQPHMEMMLLQRGPPPPRP